MFLVREVFHCKPGQVRPLVEKFKKLGKVMKEKGFGQMRIYTDMSGERYWTMVAEVDVESLESYAEMSRQTADDVKLQKAMKGYHELVESGRREIYKIEQ